VLTSRGTSLEATGKVYRACIQSVLKLGYASEISAMKVEDMAKLMKTARMMVR